MQVHALSGYFLKKSKLAHWAAYLIQVDKRIKLMGGASVLPSESLKKVGILVFYLDSIFEIISISVMLIIYYFFLH